MARKCKEDAEKTRLAILEAALDVFCEKGYARATFDEIAARAGFTKGAVYWYFRNKADLITALIIEYVQRRRAEIIPKLPKGKTLEDLLQYFIIWTEAGVKDLRFAKFNRFVLCQMEWSEAVIERVDKNLKTIKNYDLEKINEVLVESEKKGELKEGLDIKQTQHIILSTYMGLLFSSLSKRHGYETVEIMRTGLSLLLEGIRK